MLVRYVLDHHPDVPDTGDDVQDGLVSLLTKQALSEITIKILFLPACSPLVDVNQAVSSLVL
jgi:hypothetical protein